jgi:hypothetical protein
LPKDELSSVFDRASAFEILPSLSSSTVVKSTMLLPALARRYLAGDQGLIASG